MTREAVKELMTNSLSKGCRRLQIAVVPALLVLVSVRPVSADGRIEQCVDPDFPDVGADEGDGSQGGQAGNDDRALFQFDFTEIWFGTPWDPEFFGFPDWLIPDGPDGGDPGGDDPGGDDPGGDDPGGDAPYDPGYTGTSYEGWSTAADGGCGLLLDILKNHPPEKVEVHGQTLWVTLSRKSKAAISKLRLPRAVSLPDHVKDQFGLHGAWSIAAGTYMVSDYQVRLPLMPVR